MPTPSARFAAEGVNVQTHPPQGRDENEKDTQMGVFFILVAGVGFEPHDLRVMSPTSYQAALPRDIMVPEAGVEPVREKISRDFKSRASANSAIPAFNDLRFPASPLYYITNTAKSQYLFRFF